MDERPVELFVPPNTIDRPAAVPIPLAPLPVDVDRSALVVGTASIDHSGRIRDKPVLAALGWNPGDRTTVQVLPTAAVYRRTPNGPFSIDRKGQLFLPAGSRDLLRIHAGDRVMLVAAPSLGVLILHPTAVIAGLLADHYGASLGPSP